MAYGQMAQSSAGRSSSPVRLRFFPVAASLPAGQATVRRGGLGPAGGTAPQVQGMAAPEGTAGNRQMAAGTAEGKRPAAAGSPGTDEESPGSRQGPVPVSPVVCPGGGETGPGTGPAPEKTGSPGRGSGKPGEGGPGCGGRKIPDSSVQPAAEAEQRENER